VKLKADLQ